MTVLSVNARERSLVQVHSEFSDLYRGLGHDNNYLESIRYEYGDMMEIEEDLQYSKVEKITIEQASTQIDRCVFMDWGAYGEHLNRKSLAYLADRFIGVLKAGFVLSPDLYLVSNIQMEMVNNKCAILLVSNLGNEAILLQGVSFD